MVLRWCRQFKADRKHELDEERSRRPSIIMDDLVDLVRERIMENRRFTITELGNHFLILVAQNCHGAHVQRIVR